MLPDRLDYFVFNYIDQFKSSTSKFGLMIDHYDEYL
jgi:hypothetical protein